MTRVIYLRTSYMYYNANNLLWDMASSSSSKRQRNGKTRTRKSHATPDSDGSEQQYANGL